MGESGWIDGDNVVLLQNKRKRQQNLEAKQSKKYKEFKF